MSALLDATATTLRTLGARHFSLTAVAENAGVSRGTVHNAFGTRDHAIELALQYLVEQFIDTMSETVRSRDTLAEQVAEVAVLVCAHRRRADAIRSRSDTGSILVLLLSTMGDDLMRGSLALWTPLVEAARQRGEVGAGVDPKQAAEWIVRVLFSFELLPPVGVNLDHPRSVRRFVNAHIVSGLTR